MARSRRDARQPIIDVKRPRGRPRIQFTSAHLDVMARCRERRLSLAAIARTLTRMGVKVSRTTLYRWYQKLPADVPLSA